MSSEQGSHGLALLARDGSGHLLKVVKLFKYHSFDGCHRGRARPLGQHIMRPWLRMWRCQAVSSEVLAV